MPNVLLHFREQVAAFRRCAFHLCHQEGNFGGGQFRDFGVDLGKPLDFLVDLARTRTQWRQSRRPSRTPGCSVLLPGFF